MTDHEHTWDAALGVKTIGRDDTNADAYHHPYEPTPYTVLERLADSGLIGRDGLRLRKRSRGLLPVPSDRGKGYRNRIR